MCSRADAVVSAALRHNTGPPMVNGPCGCDGTPSTLVLHLSLLFLQLRQDPLRILPLLQSLLPIVVES